MVTRNTFHKAMILAAGEGIRLRPLTFTTPKVLLTIDGKPLIVHTLSWLLNHGISEVAINLHYHGENIKDLLGDGSHFGVHISYSSEETLLGTAGGVKRMEHFFDSTFVVIYGDVIPNFDLMDMIRFHWNEGSIATLAISEIPNPCDVGIVEIDEQGRVMSFVEKPPRGLERGKLVNGGVYVLERAVLDYITRKRFSDFAYDVFPELIKLGLPVYGYVMESEDCLIDIGTMAKYEKVNKNIERGRVKIRCWKKSAIF